MNYFYDPTASKGGSAKPPPKKAAPRGSKNPTSASGCLMTVLAVITAVVAAVALAVF